MCATGSGYGARDTGGPTQRLSLTQHPRALALFRIALGLCGIYTLTTVMLHGVVDDVWMDVADGGYRTLKRAQDSMMCGTLPPDDFNSSLGIFLPKGSADDDTTTSVNRTADTRSQKH